MVTFSMHRPGGIAIHTDRTDEQVVSTGQTSRLLHDLLLHRPEYCRRWQANAVRLRPGCIGKAGVAQTLALYLWDSGECPDTKTSLSRSLKDRVRRALDGEGITPQTLTWFIEGFHMNAHDAQSLWAAFAGDLAQRSGVLRAIKACGELTLRQPHRTVTLFGRYAISADRSIVSRRTWHTIMAIEDDIDVYPFSHEATVDRVEVIYGGTLGERHVHGNGGYTDVIKLDRKLQKGETTSLEYLSHYPPGTCRATEVRHPADGCSENIDIAVQFAENALPQRITWSIWPDRHDGNPAMEEPVRLDGRYSARRFVRFVEETVGFRWDW
jgi:hypothetical protein